MNSLRALDHLLDRSTDGKTDAYSPLDPAASHQHGLEEAHAGSGSPGAGILATQSFIVGNGRIARFLNFTILAQGGFRFHHSLSEIIAGHSQEYIQAVRGLFLPSNAGSLTVFVEFILKMTAEAIETGPEDKVRPAPDNSHDSEEALPAGETGKADVAAIPSAKTGDAVLPETALNSVGPVSDNSPICRNIIRALLDKKLVTATGGITRTRRYDIAPIAFEGRG